MVVVERLASSGEWRLARTVALYLWEECFAEVGYKSRTCGEAAGCEDVNPILEVA